jgi:non-canonical poly(A) RNA polymerase PAPD5/7
MYLPIADMDLVLLSATFARTGKKVYGQKKSFIYAFAAFLKNLSIAVPGSIETIAHARVPILKFVDKITGLRVDLSFDNDSGLKAIHTFQLWRAAYPAMPVIVAVIKQFLLQRGLNEVPNGGLGGFSIICLVTSLLQHIPQGYVSPNLGSILMDFLDFYGRQFDYHSVGIRMDPPEYFNKVRYPFDTDVRYNANCGQRVYGKPGERQRLAIEDPNNRDNDISGGTREIALIFRSFADAYTILKESMVETLTTDADETCFLSTVIAGCYDEYLEQREHIRGIFETDPRFASYRTHLHQYAPPPPPPEAPPTDIPPAPPSLPPPSLISQPSLPLSSASSEASSRPSTASRWQAQPKNGPTKIQRKIQASKDRAERLRALRPDLIGYIPPSISNGDAMALGRYKTQSEMDLDLAAREKQLRQQAA